MGENVKNLELIQHRNPGALSDWRLRLHHGRARLDEESPRIPDAVFARLHVAGLFSAFEAEIRQTDWAEFWSWLPADARVELFEMITG